MSDVVTCPSCHRQLRLRPELLGQDVKCPACGTTFSSTASLPKSPAPPLPHDTRRRAEESEEYDDYRPRRRRTRRYEEEEDEDRPRRRRRRRDYDDHRASLVLALGICAILGMFTFVTGPIAWVLGSTDLREMREGRMDPEGEGTTRVGMILGMVATLLFALFLLGICLLVGIAIVSSN